MSEIESIPTMSAVEHAAEVFKRTNRSDSSHRWERADAIRDAVAEEMGCAEARPMGRASDGVNDGSRKAIEAVRAKLNKAGIPEDLDDTTIGKYRTTSLAWPEEDRFDPGRVGYVAHEALAAKQWDGKRRKAIQRLLEQSTRDRVTRADVVRWKSEQDPPKPKPWDDRFEAKLNWLFRKWGERPQAPGEWQTAIRLLTGMLDYAREQADDE